MPMTGLRECIAEIAARLAAAGRRERARRGLAPPWRPRPDSSARHWRRAPCRRSAPNRKRRSKLWCGAGRAREPIAYILGEKEFWSLRFEVDPAVLIPRPETETVVEAVLEQIGDKTAALRILDLGTGSGCLLLALLSELPCALGLGVDDSAAALAVARRNAERLGLAARAEFRQATLGRGTAGALRPDRQQPALRRRGRVGSPAARDPPLRAEGGAGRRPRRAHSLPRAGAGLRAALGG